MRKHETRWKIAAALAALSLVAAKHVSPPPMRPLELPDNIHVACFDGQGAFEAMQDTSFQTATLGTLEAAWARAGHAAALYQINDTTGLLFFRDRDPPPDEYEYTIRVHDDALAVVALTIHERGKVRRLTGTDVCIQLFDILHR